MKAAQPEADLRNAGLGWRLVRLGLIGRFSGSGIDKTSSDAEVPVEMVNYTDVYGNIAARIDRSLRLMATTASPDKALEHALHAGDVLFTPSSETAEDIGWAAVVTEDMPDVVYSYHLTRWRPTEDIDPGFLRFAMNSLLVRAQLTRAAKGTTRQILTRDDFRCVKIALPDRQAQRAIADFLDAETGHIDSLIGKKRKVLDLIAQRRTSLVTALVARVLGATPRADLPWLTAVPPSWPSVPLGLLADVFNGSTPQHDQGDGGDIPWTTSGEIDQGVITVPTAYISEEARRAHGLRIAPAGSNVVGLVGQGRTRGLRARLGISTTLNQNLAAICPRDDRLDSSYVGLLLGLAYDDLRNGGRGGNQAALNCEMIKAYRIPVAPRDEQVRLVEEFTVEGSRDGAMATLLTKSIEDLLERRQALITAAVNGQVKVPGVAA